MEGREVVSLGGVGHGELSEGFFGLTKLFPSPKSSLGNSTSSWIFT